MHLAKRKYIPYAALVIFAIPLFFLNIYDTQNWGDDFAQYIKEAHNIAHGLPFYKSGYIFNPRNLGYAPPQYPPGYPLLLAPIVKIWGIAIRPLLYANTVIVTCLLLVLFDYFKKRAGILSSVCLSLAIVYTPIIIEQKGLVLSDTSCLMFIMLYLNLRNANVISCWRMAALILASVMAYLIRTQAIALLGAEAGYFFVLLIKANSISFRSFYKAPSLYIIAGASLIIFLLNKTIFYTPISTTAFYGQFIIQSIQGGIVNFIQARTGRFLTNGDAFFYYHLDSMAAQIIFAAFIIAGFIVHVRHRLMIDDIFFILMCLLIFLFPSYDQRYFLSVLPLLFFYCYVLFKTIIISTTRKRLAWVAIPMLLAYFYMSRSYLEKSFIDQPPGGIPQGKSLTAFVYIAQHVNDSDVIVFGKPRALTLYTGKKCINIAWGVPGSVNKKILDSVRTKYMLVVAGVEDEVFERYLRQEGHPVDSTTIAEGYKLYTLR